MKERRRGGGVSISPQRNRQGGNSLVAIVGVPKVEAKRILLVDPHPMVRHGVRDLISRHAGWLVCGECADGEEALKLAESLRPDLVITELVLKGGHGLDLVRRLKAGLPKVAVLVFSIQNAVFHATLAINAGAAGYLAKEEPKERLVEAIGAVLDGHSFVSPQLATDLLRQHLQPVREGSPAGVDHVSVREREVLGLLGEWKTVAQIAAELQISIRTVECYRDHLRKKLNLLTSKDLVRYAVELRELQYSRELGTGRG